MNFEMSPKARDYLTRVQAFMAEHITPIEMAYWAKIEHANWGGDWTQWQIPPELDALRAKAKALGLWNLFLPDAELGAGLTTLEYAPIAEHMGRSFLAPLVFNCNAPDSGNMGVLWMYGTAEQKKTWLEPLLAGEIRSCCKAGPAPVSR